MIAESGCVGVCLFVLGGGGGQNAYLLSFRTSSSKTTMHSLFNFFYSPTISTISHPHTMCPSLPITPPPHLPSVLESAHYAVYTCFCIQSKLYAKSDLVTYTSIHVFVCVYNTWDKLLQQEKLVPAIFASKLPFWRPVVARRYGDDILKLSL